RLSGYMLENALVAGITSLGVDVLIIGPLPTPGVAYITRSLRADAGIILSASHNPYEDNGIKFFRHDGYKLDDQVEQQIEQLVFTGEIDAIRPRAEKIGRATRIDDALGRYVEFAKASFPRGLSLEKMRIAVDVANGAAYKSTPCILRELGADLMVEYNEPNGTNINAQCGSTFPSEIQRIGKVGGRYVIEEMVARNLNLGGEQSGHMIFRDFNTTGDGIISALQILRIMKATGKPLSELKQCLKKYPQAQRNLKVKEKRPLEEMPAIMKLVGEAEKELSGKGRVLLRYSGTEPKIRLLIEGREMEQIDRQANRIAEAIQSAIGVN